MDNFVYTVLGAYVEQLERRKQYIAELEQELIAAREKLAKHEADENANKESGLPTGMNEV